MLETSVVLKKGGGHIRSAKGEKKEKLSRAAILYTQAFAAISMQGTKES